MLHLISSLKHFPIGKLGACGPGRRAQPERRQDIPAPQGLRDDDDGFGDTAAAAGDSNEA